MATAAPTDNRVYLYRLLKLNIDYGTTIVRNLIDDKCSSIPLTTVLAQEKRTITKLRANGTITKIQFDLLYPQSGIPTTADFDLTLALCLLRNLKHFVLNPGDTSLEADLCRLRMYRNELAHISLTTGIQEQEFNDKWIDIEGILHRLNFLVQTPVMYLQQMIDDCKNGPLDPEAERDIEQLIEKMQKMEVQKLWEDIRTTNERINELVLKSKSEDLKSDLIYMYRQCHQTLPISPLMDERDVLLLHVYVQPTMCEVGSDRLQRHRRRFKRYLDSYEDILVDSHKSYSYKNIYITGKAGIGKTVFAKKLALTWCQAHQPEQNQQSYFSEKDIFAMRNIDFLFFVPLGDISPTVYDVDEMIQNQILFELSKSYSMAFLEDILHYHQCLIVLDGLDQWSCGRSIRIPHRKAREHCKFITTTRSWKLDVIQLKSSQIDMLIEMRELEKPVTDQLKSKLLSTLMPDHNHNEFSEFLCRYKVENFINSPLMLTHLVCIWADQQYPLMSRGKLYESIIDLLLFSSEFKSKENQSLHRKIQEMKKSPIHLLIKNTVLNELGYLAFKMCLENKSSLIINDGEAETILSEEVLSLCVQIGLLSQKEQYGPLTYRKSTVSFLHRSVQDYFAALHLQANPSLHFQPTSQIPLSSVLEMSDTLIFLSGIDPTAAGKAIDSLHNIELVKDVFQRYRTALDSHYYHDIQTQIIKFQNMIVNCVIESKANRHKQNLICLSVKDIVINDLCLDEPYMSAMKLLINVNKSSIQSILFLDVYSYSSIIEVTEIFGLRKKARYIRKHDTRWFWKSCEV